MIQLARAVIKWTQACDRRFARLISYIHHTSDCRQYCHVGNTAQHCRLDLFQDLDFAGDFKDSKNQLREESYVSSEVEHLSPSVGCARSRHQYLTFQQNPKLNRAHLRLKCKTTRLWWTSSWRHINIHLGKDGRWSQITQNSKATMSRHMDTSSTTQMTNIIGKHWRSSCSSWAKFTRTSFCWALVRKTVRGCFLGTWIGKSSELSICSSETRIVLVGLRCWHQNGWKKAEYGSNVEEFDETCGSWRTSIISWPCVFGMYSTWM